MPVRDHIKEYWDAWLMPDMPTEMFSHAQSEENKKYWEETPAGMIYINYCDEETLKKILDGGKKATKKDGFMDEIQVG